MDVTNEILQNHIIYGGSDNTNPAYTSSSKSLNYANGASINNPIAERISVIPFSLNYADTVGLMGAENTFVRVDLNIVDTGTGLIPTINSYRDAKVSAETATINQYETGEIDINRNQPITNTYEDGIITFGDLPSYADPLISVDLANLKTGNKYIDAWFDVRLYTKDKQEYEYDKMYVRKRDYFYIGFHARNTRRLPYNVEVKIGEEYLDNNTLTPEQRRYLPISSQ